MPQPLVPILPTAPEVSIITSARQFPTKDLSDGWADGVASRDDFCIGINGWPRCPEQADYDTGKTVEDTFDIAEFSPWTMYLGVECNGGLVNPTELFNSARESLKAKRAYAIAR